MRELHTVPWSAVGIGPEEEPIHLGLVALDATDVDDRTVSASAPLGPASLRMHRIELPAAVAHPWIRGATLDALPVRSLELGPIHARIAAQAARVVALPEGVAPRVTRARELDRLAAEVRAAIEGVNGLAQGLERAGVLDRARLAELDLGSASDPDRLAGLRGPDRELGLELAEALLALAPQTERGALDRAATAELVRLRRRARFLEAYASCFGVAELLRSARGTSAVDVFVSRARDDGSRVLVTGGMSVTALGVGDAGSPFVELACLVPALAAEPLGRVAATLAQLGESVRRGPETPSSNARPGLAPDRLTPGGAVAMGRPLVPGSELAHWTFALLAGAPWDALSIAVPRTPRFLFAVGVTETERARLEQDAFADAPGIERLLRDALRLMTDPFRKSSFE